MSKEKKYWCPRCQLEETCDDDNESSTVQILTVHEVLRTVSKQEREEKGLPPKTQRIHFVCTECEREFEIKQLRKIVPFLNQTTIVISIGHVIINIMMFKDTFKLAGSKKFDDAVEAIMILWEDYIRPIPIPGVWKYRTDIKNPKTGEKEPCKEIHFLFDLVMRNVDFELGFPIDKRKLNRLMNRDEYKKRVYISKCETTSDTHVNVKMFTEKPDDFKYDVLVYDKPESEPYFAQMAEKKYARKKAVKEKFITFIVFSSAQIILTGRYDKTMKEQYEFFVETTNKHRHEIEEVINKPKMSIREYLKSMK